MNQEKQLRLLVCDPDPQGQKMIKEYLRDSSIRVFFTSPSEPFEVTLTKHSPFNAVVIDLSNPAKRSCDVLVSAVKQVAPSAEVIFMSRLADEMLWSQVLALGAYDLLAKPPERTEFLRTVFGAVQHIQAA
ncbi:MAG: response regulator [Acidobacteriia bacterium]|nr:response regulator [Terriglobia bacterium]